MEIAGIDSRWLYTALVGVVAAERAVELVVSRRNEAWLRARGAVEVGADHYPAMVIVHAAFLVACPLEVWRFGRNVVPALAATGLVTLAAAQGLRWWVVATLGRRWTTRVLCLPRTTPVTTGPFRFLSHPNYLAVAVEMVALPLIHGAWWTAVLFSIGNGLLMARRIPAEERGLAEISAGGGG